MKYELPCEVVQDLLPTYIDELTGENTRESVKVHLESCDSCRNIYRAMKCENEVETDFKTSDEERREIDFLRKTRKKNHFAILTGILGSALAVVLLVGIVFFLVPLKTVSSTDMSYEICHDDDLFVFTGGITNTDNGVAGVHWEEKDGVLNVTVRAVDFASFLHPGSFASEYRTANDIHEVTLNGKIVVWYDGMEIRHDTAQIYMDKTAFMGDHVADGQLIRDIGLSEAISETFTMELQSDEEPYGLVLHAEDEITRDAFERYQRKLPKYEALLLATIGNLGYVQIDFEVEGFGERQTITMTTEEADQLAGTSVKDAAEEPDSLQTLIDTLMND